jgi:hypothetical protein
MCRNIKTLFNFEPPATETEVADASLQFVRVSHIRQKQMKQRSNWPLNEFLLLHRNCLIHLSRMQHRAIVKLKREKQKNVEWRDSHHETIKLNCPKLAQKSIFKYRSAN